MNPYVPVGIFLGVAAVAATALSVPTTQIPK